MLVGSGPKCVAKYIVAIYCFLSLPFCVLPGLLCTSLCLVSLQAVWWLCQRDGLRQLCCQAEVCSGEWCCIPQRFLLLQWLWSPYEALWATQWGLVCERVSIWLPVILACTGNLSMLCFCHLQNKLTICQRQKSIIPFLHSYVLVFYRPTILERHCRPPSQSFSVVQDQVLNYTDSCDLSVVYFYLSCADGVQCWGSRKYLISKNDAWQELHPSTGRILVSPEAGRGTWPKCIQGCFYLLELSAAVKCCFYLCHSKSSLKGHGHWYQHSIVHISIFYICHLTEQSHLEEDTGFCLQLSFCLKWDILGCVNVLISTHSWTMWCGHPKIISSHSCYLYVKFL